MDDFEKAILCLINPTLVDENTKQSAQNYLQMVTQDTNRTWRLCLERIVKNTSRTEVLFWCFQTLTNIFSNAQLFEQLDAQSVVTLQQTLMLYIREVVAKDANLANYVKNKFCECLVALFRVTYLTQWNDFWPSLFQLLATSGSGQDGERVVDIYLRILDEIDEKIVSRLVERSASYHLHNVAIKDKMREDCMTNVVNTWYTILASRHRTLTKACLSTMKNYIDWIDINLIIGENFMKMIFSYVTTADFREEACDCLSVIVNKGMQPLDKLNILVGLQLPSIQNMTINSELEETFAAKISQLSNAIGMQLLDCWDQLTTSHQEAAMKAYNTLQGFLPFIFKLFADQDDQTSSNVVEFMNAYIAQLKKKQRTAPLTDPELAEIQTMIQVIRQKARYTEDYIFEPLRQDEYEASFLEYRRELFVVAKNATRIAPMVVKRVIEGDLLQVLNAYRTNSGSVAFSDLEIILTLFYQLGEIFPKEATDPALDNGYFQKLLAEIVSSGVSFYPHESVQISYFEIVGRYANLLTVQQQLIIPVLESFIDQRGMRNPNGTVHSRATFLFSRLVQSLQPHLHGYVEKLFGFLRDFLKVGINEPDSLGDNKLFLYEALGSILSHEKVAPQTRAAILEQLLQPIIPQMEEIISKQLFRNDTAEKPIFSKLLAEQIEVIGNLCKGLSSHKTPFQETKDIFKRVLIIVLNASKSMPDNPIVSKKIIFYLHVMIGVLGDDVNEVFPAILSHLFSAAHDISGMKDILVLFNQLVTKKQGAVFNLANEMFLPIIGKIFSMIDNATYDQASVSEDVRLKIDLHKMYFTTIYTLLTNNLGNVLTSPQNNSQFEQVLETIVKGCEHTNPHIIRVCFNSLQQAIKIWGGNLHGFENFVFHRITPVCFSVPLAQHFELSDGNFSNLLGEVISVLRLAMIAYKAEYAAYLVTRFLPGAFNISPQEANEIVTQLQSGNAAAHINSSDNKEVKKFFRLFFVGKKAIMNANK